MRKAVLFLALLAIIAAGCGGRTVLPTGFTVPTRAPTVEPSPFPTAEFSPTLTGTPDTPAAPVLEFPTAGTLMDNGRSDGLDRMAWFFDWSDVPGAEEYELYVTHSTAMQPVILANVPHSSYYEEDFDGFTETLTGWRWQVRAKAGSEWGPWSELVFFDVEEMGMDPQYPTGDICDRAELPVDRTGAVEPLVFGTPEGLVIHEYLLEKNSIVDRNFFEPAGTTREEVFALHEADRGEALLPSVVNDQQPENWPNEKVHRPVLFQGATLTATEYEADSPEGYRRSGKVTLGDTVVFEAPPEPSGLDNFFRALDATESDWFAEVAHHVTVDYKRTHELCFLGDVVQNGDSLSERYGYREAFGFQLLDGKPFYFFNQGGSIGFSYDGKASWLGFDEIPKYAEEYGSPTGGIAPEQWENAVAFFGRRGDDWYYVEIVKGP